jgi:two-component system, cell cycle response regulator
MATSLFTGQVSRVHALARLQQAPGVLLAAAESVGRSGLQALLRGWGHAVETVGDGDALLRAIELPESVPVVILDIDLPGLRGMALLHQLQLQSARRRSWTIVLTESLESTEPSKPREPAVKNISREAGVDDVLTKPVDEFELRVSLRAASRIQTRCAEMTEAIDAARFHASHDHLTGLLNRESLLNRLFQETDRTQRLGSQLSFLLLDLDHFSRVNREFGYDGGDRVLRQLASRFRRFLRSYDLAGRCGGDQFLVAMPGCTQEDARGMATRLRDCVAERPFDILQTTVTMTVSIGVAESGGRSPLAVLREAEDALSRAKLAGGGCVRWFPSAAAIASENSADAAPYSPRHLIGTGSVPV